MSIVPVPADAANKLWEWRVDPTRRIVLDAWDQHAREYRYHDVDEPDRRGEISPRVLEACYRVVRVDQPSTATSRSRAAGRVAPAPPRDRAVVERPPRSQRPATHDADGPVRGGPAWTSGPPSASRAGWRRSHALLVLLVGTVAVATIAAGVPGAGTSDGTPAPSSGRPPALAAADPVDDGPLVWRAWATVPTADGGGLLLLEPRTDGDGVVVEVGPPTSRDPWWGVGAAMTDAAATLLRDRPEALDLLFDPDVAGGAALDLVRLPLSATDFSSEHWTWDGGALPPAFADDLDVLRSALVRQPDLRVIAASWSAPPAMRTDPLAPGGALVDVDGYRSLLERQVTALLAMGVPLRAVSLGNEPGVVTDAPSMTIADDQLVDLSQRLHGPFDAVGVDLLALDHNWSDADRADRLVADGTFDAVAFHCYDGEAEAMSAFEVPTIVTECTATTGDWYSSTGWMARELVGDAVRAGSTGLVMWNLALDPAHGPKSPGGCETCRGLLTIDPEVGTIERTPEYWVLTHLSAVADPGAQVLGIDAIERLPLASFANPDGSIGVFGHNDRPDPVRVTVHLDGAPSVTVDVPSWAVFSLRTQPAGA